MTATLPNWIEHLLGVSTESGEGAAWAIEYLGVWPAWVTLLFVVFAMIFVVAIYLREATALPGRTA